ncbi:sugar transporter [Pseudomonas neustonica]|uniref:Sugar transporter n=1 Tax=Pseudomonas neustonica TaxID=2487346 RepID=A0ABX9XIZ0_9PSED|nr:MULTISPECIES: PelD GGDEF domain-containing protein [Pseudomonas]MAB22773.1 sugar transporter [Pseudomonadales bacterium]ROZ83531.1 sugar transporter [Pseudomonas sp. SSM44]ROZ85389.1 sugar transporter [Pseudomonas neustonica]|tara:strand:+ start:1456 stop:2823 length:1368 start_codon:yes stop_codon:yes gene_type:complete
MFRHTPHKDYSLTPRARHNFAWLETPILTAAVLGLCFWFEPTDPLFVNRFPWPILAPLLLAVRYGFLHAMVSAGMLVVATLVLMREGYPGYVELPASYIVGMLVSSMVVGEFRDLWERRLQRLQMANEYRQFRLDEFTRAYQMLRSSHDRLEERVAGSETSLRSSLLLLRKRVLQVRPETNVLKSSADSILSVLGQYGSFNAAALYPVVDGQLQVSKAYAEVGDMGALDANDLLIRLCLERADVVSVRDVFREQGREKSVSGLQACVPLVTVDGELLAIVVVRSMPFFSFNERTFMLLALLGGHIADLLHSDAQVLALENNEARRFSQHLQRSVLDAEKHDLPGSLMCFELPADSTPVLKALVDSQRGLDLQLSLSNSRGIDMLLVLMPLTDAQGSQGYLGRLDQIIAERMGGELSLQERGITSHYHELGRENTRAALSEFLYRECGLNDQQVAI